jgi:DnaJ-domain-containing protein 1
MRRPRFLQIILLLALSWSVQASGRAKLNVFDKPNEQSEARFDSAMARKGGLKTN